MVSFFQELLEMFKSRVKNVFYSTFAISWLFINWKFLFILFFSDKNPTEIFKELDVLYPSCLGKWWYFFISPVVVSLIHIFLLSRFNENIYSYWLNYVKRLSNKKKEIEGEILLTVQESRKLRVDHANIKMEKDKMEKEHRAEMEALRNEYEGKLEIIKKKEKKCREEIRALRNKTDPNHELIKKPNDKKKQEKNSVPMNKDLKGARNFQDIIKQMSNSEFNVLKSEHFREMIFIYEKGGSKYNLDLPLTRDKEARLKNFLNIFREQGFEFYITQKRVGLSTLHSIQWDRSKFKRT